MTQGIKNMYLKNVALYKYKLQAPRMSNSGSSMDPIVGKPAIMIFKMKRAKIKKNAIS